MLGPLLLCLGMSSHLGKVDFPVTCSPEARIEFNHAVALLHHMTYPQAREAFQNVAAIDPNCAMAHWGIAMTLFQPLWPTRPGPAALQQGWQAVEKAKALHAPTEREQLFIAAVEAFFLDPTSNDYWLRIRRWESGRWEYPPSGSSSYVPDSWQRQGNGYVYVRGHWQ